MTTKIKTEFATFVSNDPKLADVEGRVVEYGGRGDQESFLVARFKKGTYPEVLDSVQLTSLSSKIAQREIASCLKRVGFREAAPHNL